ncbi:MAG TPA: ATP-binding protein [Acidimicrobiia bacterium]|jgi:two-component system sensor histidine kinase SenX3
MWFIVAAALAVAAAAVIVAWRTGRGVRRDLQESIARLGDEESAQQQPLESALARLERVADDADAAARDERRDRELLGAAIHAARDGVIIVDAAGSVVLRSEAAERFVDPRHSDAIAAEVITELLDRARTGETARRELQLFGPPRQVLLVESLPLALDGTVGAVAFVRDVSEARRVENVRRDFVANVSHELKTPIGALALLAETIAMGDDPAIAQQLGERMVREADRLGRIIDDLLDLSLIEAQETPTREPVPVHVLLNDAVEHVQEAADLAGIPIVLAPVPADLLVRCDRRQVVSAIANLLDNAVKYSDPGQPVELDAHVDAERIAVTVRDHGIGIPSRDLERIFERFYRVDRARSRATGGTGLGLSIVRHVAQAHGGEVGVESREGEGSTFTLQLPIARRRTGGTDLKVS